MSEQLTDKELHDYLELIAASGCADVNQLIIDYDKGVPISEIAHLNVAQQQQVVIELRKVMQIYDSCEVQTKS